MERRLKLTDEVLGKLKAIGIQVTGFTDYLQDGTVSASYCSFISSNQLSRLAEIDGFYGIGMGQHSSLLFRVNAVEEFYK